MTAATSSPREHVTRALKRNGLLEFLKQIDTTSEVGESKHSPLIYQRVQNSWEANQRKHWYLKIPVCTADGKEGGVPGDRSL